MGKAPSCRKKASVHSQLAQLLLDLWRDRKVVAEASCSPHSSQVTEQRSPNRTCSSRAPAGDLLPPPRPPPNNPLSYEFTSLAVWRANGSGSCAHHTILRGPQGTFYIETMTGSRFHVAVASTVEPEIIVSLSLKFTSVVQTSSTVLALPTFFTHVTSVIIWHHQHQLRLSSGNGTNYHVLSIFVDVFINTGMCKCFTITPRNWLTSSFFSFLPTETLAFST